MNIKSLYLFWFRLRKSQNEAAAMKRMLNYVCNIAPVKARERYETGCLREWEQFQLS